MIDTVIPIFGKTEYGSKDAALLGGKGAHLAELHNLGLTVPPLVNLTTDAYHQFHATQKDAHDGDLVDEFAKTVNHEFCVKGLDIGVAMLVSVRSGAPVSMPGMMDTILNVGLSLDNEEYWSKKFGVKWFWDSYSRLLIQLADALGVGNLPTHDAAKGFRNAQIVTGLLIKSEVNVDVLTQPVNALRVAIRAVFASWDTERAIYYRDMNGIPHDIGTACSIQQMVFGNIDDQSGTGVMFTRNPSNGENIVTGEFLVQAQGEDVVDGSTTPMSLKDLKKSTLPDDIGAQLFVVAETLEAHFLDMQDVEFTIEQGKLWILQTRTAKRTSEAAFRIAVEMIEDEEIQIGELSADNRITFSDWHSVKGVRIHSAPTPTFTGLAAGSGVAQGLAVFTSQAAVEATEPVILVRPETTPDDIAGMYNSQGIVTFEGGMTSHAAVVARGMNKPCIVGVEGMAGNISEGDMVTIDSATGLIWINAEIVLNSRGGSEYADRYVTLLQTWRGVLIRRNTYRPYSLLQVSAMSDGDFDAMIKQVKESGAWYDYVWLDLEAVAPYRPEESGLTALAELALPITMGPMMKKRIAKLKTLKITPHYVSDAPIANSVPAVLNATYPVLIDDEKWKQFLGNKLFEEVKASILTSENGNRVFNWLKGEDEALADMLSGGTL